MKSKILIWTIALILLCSLVYGAPPTDTTGSWSMDDADTVGSVIIDWNNTHNGTGSGTTSGQLGRWNESWEIGQSDEIVIATGSDDAFTCPGGSCTISAWVNLTDDTGTQNILNKDGSPRGIYFQIHTSGKLRFLCGATNYRDSNNDVVDTNTWYHLVLVKDAGTLYMYVDNVSVAYGGGGGTIPAGACGNPSADTLLGGYNNNEGIRGTLDQVDYYDRALSNTEVGELYAEGNPHGPPPPPPPGNTTDIDFTITDDWNSTSINSFNINLTWQNGTQETYLTTNGTVSLTNVSDSNININVTYWNMTDYFDKTLLNEAITANTTNTVTTTTFQAYACFNVTAKVNEAWVTADNFTIESTTQACFNITAGTHNVLAQKAGWYNQNQSFSITALSNATYTVQNMSYANLTIYVIDGTTNESLSGYNINMGSIANPSFLESASGVTNHSFYLINDTYNTTVTMPGYATTTGYANISVSGHTNYTFTLYRSNSVTITILDEITNDPILSNITIRWTTNATTWENTTDTGSFFISNLTATNYTLLFYGSNYSTRTYTLTVGNLSTQFLTAYMISSEYSTIFTILDQDTGDVLADVSFTASKLVNSTWETVESKYSDITGKVQMYYDPIGNYRFYLTKDDYEDLVFYLNPILFGTYDVKMEKSSLLNYSVDYDDISLIYSPQEFDNNENTTFNFLISSPDGLLTSYGFTITYPGGSASSSGVNAIGEQLSGWVNITGATVWDRVRLDYNYTTSISGTRTFTKYLTIRTNTTTGENTWSANKDRTYGLGLFERVLIVTIIVIFTVGIASMVGQPIPGFAIGLFLFGFMVKIGFIPIWSILPSMFIGFLFLVWKSGGY